MIWNPSDHIPLVVDVELDVRDNNLSVEASIDILSQPARNDMLKAKKIRPEKLIGMLIENLLKAIMSFIMKK